MLPAVVKSCTKGPAEDTDPEPAKPLRSPQIAITKFPMIDTAELFENKVLTVKDNMVKKLSGALSQNGICFLSNMWVTQSKVDKVLAASKQFFEQDAEVKGKYARGQGDCHGWMPLEVERLNPKRTVGDRNESFNFTPGEGKEMPADVPDMGKSFTDMFNACHLLCARILDLLGVALELKDPGELIKSHKNCGKKGSFSTLRSMYFHPGPLKEDQMHSGEHSDYGSISLLFHAYNTAGVQIRLKDGKFLDLVTPPGKVLLCVGDMVQRWTSDKYPAVVHRENAPAAPKPWQSLTFFYYPDDQAVVSCLDGSDTYPPVTPSEYLMSKFKEFL